MFATTQEIVINRPLTLRGVAFDRGNREDLNGMSGCVSGQRGEGNDGIKITVNNETVHLENLGIQFDGSLSSTGHGINCVPPDNSDGSNEKDGLVNAFWSNLAVSGHDLDKYTFRFVNLIHNEFHSLRSTAGDGGGFQLIADHDQTNFGNAKFFECWASPVRSASTHAYELVAENTTLNRVGFYRTQAIITSTKKPPKRRETKRRRRS